LAPPAGAGLALDFGVGLAGGGAASVIGTEAGVSATGAATGLARFDAAGLVGA
jgi:hypothetical protein